MSRYTYHMDDCVISVPEGFRDRAIHVLEWAAEDESPIVLIVQRDKLANKTLEEYVEQDSRDYDTRFKRHAPEELPEGPSLPTPCVQRAFRWVRGEEVLYNRHVYLADAALVICMMTSGLARHRPRIDQIAGDAVESLCFRED